MKADCSETRRALDGELARPGLAEAVRAHLETCLDCRRYLAELRRRPGRLRALAPGLAGARARGVLDQLKLALRKPMSW